MMVDCFGAIVFKAKAKGGLADAYYAGHEILRFWAMRFWRASLPRWRGTSAFLKNDGVDPNFELLMVIKCYIKAMRIIKLR